MHHGEYLSNMQTSVVAGPVEGGRTGVFWTYRTGVMRDPASELRRITLPRTPVNKGKKEGRGQNLRPLVEARCCRFGGAWSTLGAHLGHLAPLGRG
jgi:hypothetical protein